jgi:hypothetical protein
VTLVGALCRVTILSFMRDSGVLPGYCTTAEVCDQPGADAVCFSYAVTAGSAKNVIVAERRSAGLLAYVVVRFDARQHGNGIGFGRIAAVVVPVAYAAEALAEPTYFLALPVPLTHDPSEDRVCRFHSRVAPKAESKSMVEWLDIGHAATGNLPDGIEAV